MTLFKAGPFQKQNYKVLSSVRLCVPQVQRVPDDVVEDNGVDGKAKDEAEDGEDEARNEDGDAKFVGPLHS